MNQNRNSRTLGKYIIIFFFVNDKVHSSTIARLYNEPIHDASQKFRNSYTNSHMWNMFAYIEKHAKTYRRPK